MYLEFVDEGEGGKQAFGRSVGWWCFLWISLPFLREGWMDEMRLDHLDRRIKVAR